MTYTLPRFIVVGGEKCGTTSIFNYLQQHPDIFLPPAKECRYFSNIGQRLLNPFTKNMVATITASLESYKALFTSCTANMPGDVSPDYLFYYQESIANISATVGSDIKIIIILRDPVERAFSNYLHLLREDLTNLPFEDYLKAEDNYDRTTTWWGFFLKDAGLFSRPVEAYIAAFPSVHVIFFEDYIANPEASVRKIFEFLGLSTDVPLLQPVFTNKTGAPRYSLVDFLLRRQWPGKNVLKRLLSMVIRPDQISQMAMSTIEKNLRKPVMPISAVRDLQNFYLDDVHRLEGVLGRTVPWQWFAEQKADSSSQSSL